MKKQEQKIAEMMTGCEQRGDIVFHNNKDEKITKEQAKILFAKGDSIDIPEAGAGNYREIFEVMGFSDVETIDHTSSAGDWLFGAKKDGQWFLISQENRYPYHGYRYSAVPYTGIAETFEDLCQQISDYYY